MRSVAIFSPSQNLYIQRKTLASPAFKHMNLLKCPSVKEFVAY